MTGNSEPTSRRHGNRWKAAAWTAAAGILLLPLIAMQFTDEVVWDLTDFAVFGALLAVIGGALEWVVRKTGDASYRLAAGLALATAIVLIWVNGAVGIIGTEGDPANLMFGGVLIVGIIGAIIARFKPVGMARALLATAFAQTLVAVIAFFAGHDTSGPIWPLDILILSAGFTALWCVSAWLFRRAAQVPPSTWEGSES